MARTGSTTTRRTRAKATDEQATTETPVVETDTTEAVPAEATTEAQEGDKMSTETVEAEAPASDTTETVETVATTDTTADGVSEEAKAKEQAAEQAYTDFRAAVITAADERDVSAGTVPVVQIEAVKEKYRALDGAKYKGRAKKSLNDDLKDAINKQDLMLGTAFMQLADAIENAGPQRSSTPASERKPADPAQAYRDNVTVLHLAYSLAVAAAPEGVSAEDEHDAITTKVAELNDAAVEYYKWATSTAEDKGDEPEVDGLIKRAVKAATGKAPGRVRTAGSSAPRSSDGSGGARRNVRTHIAQVFDKLGKVSGEFLKVSEIANTATDEYPSADCSAGAISAALKSTKGVEGFKLTQDENGHAAALKL